MATRGTRVGKRNSNYWEVTLSSLKLDISGEDIFRLTQNHRSQKSLNTRSRRVQEVTKALQSFFAFVKSGSLFVDCCVAFPGTTATVLLDEVITFYGSNPENPHDLGGEVESWLGGDKHIFTKSVLVYVCGID